MLKVRINDEINEYYIKYHKDDKYNYYVYVGNMYGVPRFIWLSHNIKRSIYLIDIPNPQQSNEAPIKF